VKILFLIHQFFPEYYTGTERFVLNLATMTQKAGHKVKVLTYSFYEDAFYDQRIGNIPFKEFTYQSIPVLAFKYKQMPEDIHFSLENGDLCQVAKDMIRREKPDLVHVAHTMRVGELVTVLPSLGIPYVMTLTDFFLICPKYTLYTSKETLCGGPEGGSACQVSCPEFKYQLVAERLRSAKNLLFNAKLVVSPSRFLADKFRRECPDLNFRIISHGLRYGVIKRNGKTYAKGDGIIFCYAGSLNPHKGVHLLIEAFRNVRSRTALLKIYGSGPNQDYVNKLIAMAEGDTRVRFCGVFPGEKVGEILVDSDVAVVPSLWYENAPIIIREAMACHVPVIGADVGGMAENISHGVNGFLFRIGNPRHLQEVLQNIVDDPELINAVKAKLNGSMFPTVEQEAYAYDRIYARTIAER
jgi:glycosyltransferase involved in cell wall biosynthesis